MGTPGGKMSVAISQVPASLESCFYARFIVRMALRRLTEKKHSSIDEFNRELAMSISQHGYIFYPHMPYTRFRKMSHVQRYGSVWR